MTAAAGAATIDPRMRARRTEVMRAQGRRRLRVILLLLVVLMLLVGAWRLTLTPLLDLDRITVTGVDSARAAEVLRGSRLQTGTPMLYIDIGEVGDSLEGLSWVESARVRRHWPGTVSINVTPRVPIAVAPGGAGRAVLIDAAARAVAWAPEPGADSPHSQLPLVSVPFEGGPGEVNAAAGGPLAVVEALPADLRPWVESVTLGSTGAGVGMELRGGASVVLGEPILLDDKVSAVRAVLAGADLQCVTEIDVIMPDITTLTRHPSCRL